MNRADLVGRTGTLLGLAVLTAALTGCVAPAQRQVSRNPKATIAVTLTGGGAPSPRQVAGIHAAMQAELLKNGYELAPDLRTADYVVHVRFTADALGGPGGHLSILGVDAVPSRAGRPPTPQPQAQDGVRDAAAGGSRSVPF